MSELIVTQLQAFYLFISREPLAAVLLLELGRTLAGAVAS